MNDYDLNYLKERISYLRRKEPEFPRKGELQFKDICYLSADELERMVECYEKERSIRIIEKIKHLVNEVFNKYGEDGDNMIILSAAYVPEREIYECDEYMEVADFGGFKNKYNPFYYPITRNWKQWSYKLSSKEEEEYDKEWRPKWNSIYSYSDNIMDLLEDLGIKRAEDYWKENNSALNMYWYGFIGITKDYKVVSFVMRDDGMLCSERSMNEGYNSILKRL